MKTQLVFVVNSLEGGGAERVITTLANYLSSRSFSVTIICLNKAEQAYKVSSEIQVLYLTDRKTKTSILYRIGFAMLTFLRLLFFLYKRKPNCVISFMATSNLWTGAVCWLLNIPYFVSERITPDYTLHQYNRLTKWISFKIYKNSKAIIIPSKGMEECFKKYRLFESVKNFQTIHNPVSSVNSTTASKVYHNRFILGVGRLDRQKGFDLLIEAYRDLDLDDLDLLISGEGPERDNLQHLIDSYGLHNKVKLIGFQKNIASYYKQAELFVLSSRNEGYPNVLVEAMSYGCAVIATDCEYGPSEIIINEKNGLLVSPHSSRSLSKGISRLLSDPLLKYQISQNAILVNQTNSLEAISAKWENLILSHV